MICLNSKTYCAFKEHNKKMKTALKGSNKNLESPLERFESVLFNKVPLDGSNKGFPYYRGKMFTNKQINVHSIVLLQKICEFSWFDNSSNSLFEKN